MLELHIDTQGLLQKQARHLKFFQVGFLKVFKRFRVYMLQQTGFTFRTLARGGTFRGVTWPWYAHQYTRVTDLVTVPAQGRVPKVRGKGTVKGKKRPSGQRITGRSNLMRDTGRLAAAAGMTLRFSASGKTMILGTNVSYAARQQALRPFLFFQVPQDAQILEQYVIEEIEKLEKEGGAP